ncbi:YbaN family protein [Halomonas aquamarina]|uniref:YbaN family protein n=2 Tax=Vreelandella aquamarina TaxID=77097 RepID=A0ACC5VXG6_9GAMM|nr:YbaN family protein [Halomonas aquamarina]
MTLKRALWVGVAALSFGIGVLGIFLPLLPTTEFMLGAVYCASKGSPRFEAWIRSRRYVGPLIRNWECERAISRRAKLVAVSMIGASALFILLHLSNGWLRWSIIALLAGVAAWLATRPEPTPDDERDSGR